MSARTIELTAKTEGYGRTLMQVAVDHIVSVRPFQSECSPSLKSLVLTTAGTIYVEEAVAEVLQRMEAATAGAGAPSGRFRL